MFRPFFLLIFLSFLLLPACERETSFSIQYDTIVPSTNDDLYAIAMHPTGLMLLAGGVGWERGILLKSNDFGRSWITDTLVSATLSAVTFTANGYGRVVGKSGIYYHYAEADDSWSFVRFPAWDNLSSVAVNQSGHTLAVGGSAWENGHIWQISPQHQLLRVDSFPNELSAVCFRDSTTAFAVGYGIALKTEDMGLHWQYIDLQGDFFTDVCFVNEQRGFIIGAGGFIARSDNGGETWEVLQKPSIFPGRNPGLRAISFNSDQVGYICGDKGLLWKTIDGGLHWQQADNLPPINFKDVLANDTHTILAGENGTILLIDN